MRFMTSSATNYMQFWPGHFAFLDFKFLSYEIRKLDYF